MGLKYLLSNASVWYGEKNHNSSGPRVRAMSAPGTSGRSSCDVLSADKSYLSDCSDCVAGLDVAAPLRIPILSTSSYLGWRKVCALARRL